MPARTAGYRVPAAQQPRRVRELAAAAAVVFLCPAPYPAQSSGREPHVVGHVPGSAVLQPILTQLAAAEASRERRPPDYGRDARLARRPPLAQRKHARLA